MDGTGYIDLWVDDHAEYTPGVVSANLRHARRPLDPMVGDLVVVGDDDVDPALAEVVGREGMRLRLQLLPGPADSHPQFAARHGHVSA